MPIYKNTSFSHLFLPREDGKVPDISLHPNDTFNGSEAFYKRYVGNPHYLITRQVDGYNAPCSLIAGPNLKSDVEGFIKRDGIIASDEDEKNNTQVTSGTSYSAFGKITLDDGTGTLYSFDFSITGDGDHGGVNESVFNVSGSTPAGSAITPLKDNSRIECINGYISFRLSGAGSLHHSVEVVYEKSDVGHQAVAFLNQLLDTSKLSYSYTYVSAASDVGSEYYVAGSANQIKT